MHNSIQGIPNFNNTCYLNALLQAFSALGLFAKNNGSNGLFMMIGQICNMINSNAKINFNHINDIFKYIRDKNWIIPSGEQDCFELYQVMYEIMESETDVDTATVPFKVMVKTKIECLNCGYIYPTLIESHSAIMLTINISSSLLDYVYDYFKNEIIQNYKCEKCLTSTSVVKRKYLVESSNCLVLQFQRLLFTHNSNNAQKIHKLLRIPLQLHLDAITMSHKNQFKSEIKSTSWFYVLSKNLGSLNKPSTFYKAKSPFLLYQSILNRYTYFNPFIMSHQHLLGLTAIKSDKSNNKIPHTKYQLKAIIQHHTLDEKSGHFTTIRCDLLKNQWYLVSDLSVKSYHLPAKTYITCPAYIVFYELAP